MADLRKEMLDAIREGVTRLIVNDQAFKMILVPPPGRTVGTGVAFKGASDIQDDTRTTTGYDPATGLTLVGFVLGVSELDGDDGWSM